MSGTPRQRCSILEKFDEHLRELEGEVRQALSKAEIIENFTKSVVRYMVKLLAC
ncbi:hypothetical protein HAX54_021163, partial [Datura stramonium]|nr:hypothetical protein [Datura stramonium]